MLGAHTTRRRKFSEYDVSFLAAVANVIAGAIQRRQLDHRQELMIRELRHRSGNLFAQLLALFSQTAKNSKNVAELVTKYEARVLALANAHRLDHRGRLEVGVADGDSQSRCWRPISIASSFAGPDVFLEPDPTFGLSMAVHELATNASKYGSLSARAGPGRGDLDGRAHRARIDACCSIGRSATARRHKRNRRPGFGSRLINMVIERQLNGEVQQSFEAEGPGGQADCAAHPRALAGRPGACTSPARADSFTPGEVGHKRT